MKINLQKIFSKLHIIVLILTISTLFGCNKRDPNPHLKDEVYNQLLKDLGEVKAKLTEKEKDLDTIKLDYSKITPQSGENAAFKSRIEAKTEYVTILKQYVRAYEIKIAERQNFVQKKYLESLLPEGKPWPDQIEIDSSLRELKLLKLKYQEPKPKEKKADPIPIKSNSEGKPDQSQSKPLAH